MAKIRKFTIQHRDTEKTYDSALYYLAGRTHFEVDVPEELRKAPGDTRVSGETEAEAIAALNKYMNEGYDLKGHLDKVLLFKLGGRCAAPYPERDDRRARWGELGEHLVSGVSRSYGDAKASSGIELEEPRHGRDFELEFVYRVLYRDRRRDTNARSRYIEPFEEDETPSSAHSLSDGGYAEIPWSQQAEDFCAELSAGMSQLLLKAATFFNSATFRYDIHLGAQLKLGGGE